MHQIFFSIATSFALASAAATPNNLQFPFPSAGNCDLSQAKLDLPANAAQFNLTIPTGHQMSAIAAGFGVQNYTCNPTSKKFSSIGAVAELVDITCAFSKPGFDTIQNDWFAAWNSLSSSSNIQAVIEKLKGNTLVYGQHYFIQKPGNPSPVPVFDFRPSMKTYPGGFVVGAKLGDMPAPTGSGDVDWLKLKRVEGDLASVVFRLNTRGGQPPTTCNPGDTPISVNYAATYFFFK